MKISAYISWVMLVLVLVLWGIVAYVVFEVQTQKEAHAGLIASAQDRAIKDTSLVKLRALLNETKAERAAFYDTIPSDVLNVVELMETVGKNAGVDIEISNAQRVGVVNEKAGVSSVSFVIQTKGSFAQLTRVAELLNSVQNPSQIDQLDLSTDEKSKDWYMTARVKFLIAAPTSS